MVVNGVTYAAFGPATGWAYGNGRQLQRTLDLDYRPKAVHDPAAGGLSLGFGYDPVGSITELKNGTGSAVLAKYAYDSLGRLTQTQDGATSTPIETYGYDATGNRTSLTTSAGTSTYTYPATSHRLTAVDGEARNQDAAGNTTSIGSKVFTYNDANRMNAVKQGNAVLESYGYNHRGERVLRTPAGGNSQITVYDEAGQWLGNDSATGVAQQQAIWLDDYPVALINVPSTGVPELAYIQPDHLGTPRVVIDPMRDVAIWEWSSRSEVFGDQAPANDPDGDGVAFDLSLRFPGQQATDASGMFYNYQREYDPKVGRYSQSDPIGLMGGVSTYSYVGGNPLVGIDSLGLCELKSVCRTLPGMPVFSEAAQAAISSHPSSRLNRIWPFSALRGTRIHVQFATNVKANGPPYDAEVSYLYGIVVDYGTPGSIRADGIYGPRANPKYAVELKSGAAGLTAAEIRNYYKHLPPGTILCGILER